MTVYIAAMDKPTIGRNFALDCASARSLSVFARSAFFSKCRVKRCQNRVIAKINKGKI